LGLSDDLAAGTEYTLVQDIYTLPNDFRSIKEIYASTKNLLTYAPPTCILKIGALLIARVVLTGGEVSWRAPIDTATLLPYHSEYSATFAVLRRFQPDLGYRFDGHWQ
jgi:hypothetical protein